MTDLNQLKQEVLDELIAEEFAIFRSQPGSLENMPLVFWDTRNYPDYHGFLNTAKQCGVRVIIFSTRTFEQEELDETLEQLGEGALSREERGSYEEDLRGLKRHVETTCTVELAFSSQGQMYVYQAVAAWYDSFLNITDAIEASTPDEDDAPPLGGYFSKN